MFKNRYINLFAAALLLVAITFTVGSSIVKAGIASKADRSFHTPPMSDYKPVDNVFHTPPMSDYQP